MSTGADQRTDEWRQDRAGRITGSRFTDVISVKKDGKSTAERAKLMRQLAFERMAGIPAHEVGGKALAWGTEVEPVAVQLYELHTGNIVTPSPFVVHPRYDFVGSSPDGLVGAKGGIEIKSPHDEGVHINTWLEGMPAEHMPQVQGNMWVTGRDWWDFISYDPRQCERLRLYVQRVPRDDAYIASMAAAILQFEAELQQMIEQLMKKSA